MPEIPRARRTQTIPGVSGSVKTDVGSAGVVGRSISNLGNALMMYSDKLKQQDDANQEILLRSQYDDEQRAFKGTESQKTGSDSYDNVERGKEFRDLMLKKYTNEKNPAVKAAMAQYVTSRSTSLLDSLSIHQASQRDIVTTQAAKAVMSGLLKDAYAGDPLNEINHRLLEVVAKQDETGSISDEEAVEQLRIGQSSLAEAHLDGLINRDPMMAIGAIEAGGYDKFLSQEQIETYDKKAKVMQGALKKDVEAMAKEKERLAKIALKEAQNTTGHDFLQKLLNGTLTQSEILKSNLNPTGENSQKTWVKELEARKKKLKDGEKWKTDREVEAELQTRIVNDPESVTDAEILEKQGNGLSTDDAKALIAYKAQRLRGEDDPQKSADAKTAHTRLREAKTARLFSGNRAENSKEWAEAVNQLTRFIENHPNENPNDFVDQVLEPVKDGVLRRVFDFLPFVDPYQSEEERQLELEVDAGIETEAGIVSEGGKTVTKPMPARPGKRVQTKIYKRPDGTYYQLYPNGIKKDIPKPKGL